MVEDRKVRRILELRKKLVQMTGYTAGAEGLLGDLTEYPASFWIRASKAYQLMLADEDLTDDVTDEEIKQIILKDGW